MSHASRHMAIGLVVALLLHGTLAVWSLGLHEPVLTTPPRPATRAVNMDVVLPKPAPRPTPPAPPVVPAPPAVAKAEPPVKTPPRREQARKSKPKRARKAKRTAKAAGQPKRAAKPAAAPSTPPPLVLSQTYEGAGGVAVQKGDADILGNPAIEVTDANRNAPPTPVAGDATGDDEGDDGGDGDDDDDGAMPKIRRARPKQVCAVSWPADAPRERRIVEVRLLLTVSASGQVRRASVLKSVGQPFDKAAVKALQRCAFEPGTRDGRPFVDRVPFIVEFRPTDDA